MSEDTSQPAPSTSAPIAADYPCPRCGYNLRGLLDDRCPECGSAFDRATLSDSRIPWVHRSSRGRFRAYWATVRMVTLRPRQLAYEMSRPVSYGDAQWFRWVTIVHGWLPAFVAMMVQRMGVDRLAMIRHASTAFSSDWLTFGFHASLLGGLAVATGVPSYLFHPRWLPVEKQNRTIALSYYAAAPLAWTPVIFGLGWLVQIFVGSAVDPRIVIDVLAVVLWLCWWWNLVVLTRHAVARTSGGTVLVGLGVPTLWVLLAGLTMFGVEALLKYAGLFYFSLQD